MAKAVTVSTDLLSGGALASDTADGQPSLKVTGVAQALAQRRARRRWKALAPVARWTAPALFVTVLVVFTAGLLSASSVALTHFGLRFFWSGTLNATQGIDGAGVLVVGTLLTTVVALLMALPVGVGSALAMSEFAPAWLSTPLSVVVDLLAAVPSVVVGMWGLLVLEPVFANHIEPWLGSIPGLDAIFRGPYLGSSVLLAGVVLAVMVLPTLIAFTRIALAGVPRSDREGAQALGATRWQVARRVVLPGAASGLRAAVVLGVGRALGEGISVSMVIGNRDAIPHSLLAPGSTVGSFIVNQFGEANPGLPRSSVVALVVVLMVISGGVSAVGVMSRHRGKRAIRPARGTAEPGFLIEHPHVKFEGSGDTSNSMTAEGAAGSHGAQGGSLGSAGSGDGAPRLPEMERRNRIRSTMAARYGRRRVAGKAWLWTCRALLVISLVPIVAVAYTTIQRGWSSLGFDFFFHIPTPPGVPGGGVGDSLIGSVLVVGVALLIAVPLAVATSTAIVGRDNKFCSAVRFGAEVMYGVPSIAIGIFVYTAIVVPIGHASALAGSVALAILMLPIMIRSDEEAMNAVPVDLWEAGLALGARRSKVIRSVVLRGALPGIITGNLLATARAAGETAPVMFVIGGLGGGVTWNPLHGTAATPLSIFSLAQSPFSPDRQTAWSLALVLLAAILVLSMSARLVGGRLTRKAR